VTPAADEKRPPLWVWPSIVMGLLYPALARSARLDVELLERLPDPPTNLRRLPTAYSVLLVAIAVGLALVFSLLRFGAPSPDALPVPFGIDYLYTESVVFMLAALLLGMASPAAGLLLVLIHLVFDLVVAIGQGQLEPLLPALAGRLVSVWVLWLLAVAIPLMARSIPGTTLASGQPADPRLRRLLALGAAGVTAGVLIFIWTQAVPLLVRPAFIWATRSNPTYEAVAPVQENPWAFVVVGIAAVLLVSLVRLRFGVLDEEVVELQEIDDLELDALEDEGELPSEVEFVGRLMAHALTIVALGGLVSGFFDVALMAAALIVARPLAVLLLRRIPGARLVARIPWVIRFIGAFGVTYVAGLIVTGLFYDSTDFSEFLPLVLTVALGLFLFQLLFAVDDVAREAPARPAEEATEPGPSPGAAMVLAALLFGLSATLALPGAVAADNCSGLIDCYSTSEAGAIAAAGAAGAAAVGVAAAVAGGQNRSRRPKRPRRKGTAPPPESAPAAGRPSPLERLRRRALRNYGRRR
jgi:hypothetical protein